MKKIIYAVALLFISVSTSQAQLSRDLIAFRELDVTDKINVNIILSNENKIVIEGELANQMELTQVDDILRLKMTSGYILQGNKVNVTLYSSNLKSIIARKGSNVSSHAKEILQDSLYLSASEGAQLDVQVNVGKVQVLSTTGAKITAFGKVNDQAVNIALGGSYFGKNLVSNTTVARVNAGGKCEINVKNDVDVQTRAGGTIDIYGKPTTKKEKKIAGGKINYL